MGINGLLPFLKKIHSPVNISQFAGCTVAIDAYCWLHKGAFSCAEKLALGEPTDQYIYYCLKYVNYLLEKGLKPILVFDGCHLPSKKDVETSRRERREVYRKKAAQFLRDGRRAEAKECLQRCIDVTSEMARKLIEACRKKGVDCIVAPYEADAQLSYLSKSGIAQLIVTEDSDLLLFGCDKIIFKMDFFGNGVLIESDRLNEVLAFQDGRYTFDKFRQLCILSGCDYLPSLPGIGLATACKAFKIARQADLRQFLRKLPIYLKKSFTVPDDYIDAFICAENTFLYQLVFDPLNRRLAPLNPYPENVSAADFEYAGPYLPNSKALNIALGNIDLYTKEKVANFNPDTDMVQSNTNLGHRHMLSVWDKDYRIRSQVPLKAIQPLERPNLKGKEVITSVKIIKHSLKRSREVEASPDCKSDSEFSSLYSAETLACKKHRLSDEKENSEVDCSAGILASLLDEEVTRKNDDLEEPVNLDNSGSFNTDTKDDDDDEDDDSKASVSVIEDLNEEDSPSIALTEESFVSEDLCKKTDLIKSPSEDFTVKLKSDALCRNRFAVHTKIKERFNINATKVEVKSRFFAQSSSPAESKMDITSPERPKVDKLAFKSPNQHRFERNRLSSMEKNSLSVSSEEIMHKGRTSSNASAFSWRQQQFVRNQSMDNFSALKSGNNQGNGNQQFQIPSLHCNPLVRHNSDGGSRIGGGRDNSTRTVPMPDSEAYTSRNLDNECGQSDINQSVTASTFFNMSRCPSMNLSESPGSQDDDDAEQGSQKHTPVNSPIESWIGSTEELKSPSSHSSVPVNDNAPTQLSSTPKPACRVSSLSKSRGAKSKQSNASVGAKPSGQQSIKDMFSKFAYSKGTKPLST